MNTLLLIALVTLMAILVIAFWAGWAPEGRRVLPAVEQSRPVERVDHV